MSKISRSIISMSKIVKAKPSPKMMWFMSCLVTILASQATKTLAASKPYDTNATTILTLASTTVLATSANTTASTSSTNTSAPTISATTTVSMLPTFTSSPIISANTTITPMTTVNTTTTLMTTVNTTAPPASAYTTASTTPGGTIASITSGNTTASITSGSTTASITSGSTTASITSGSTTAPITSGNTTAPITSGSTTAPITSGSTTGPITSGSTTTPIKSGRTTASITSGSTTAPITSGSATASITSGSTTGPITSGSTTPSITFGSTTASITSESTTASITPESTIAPTKSSNATEHITTPSTIASTIRTTSFVENITYYEYSVSMTLTKISIENDNSSEKQQQKMKILRQLLDSCSEEYTRKDSIHFFVFQNYLKSQICGIDAFLEQECRLTITKLECGSLITKSKLVLGVKGSDPSGISKGKAGNIVRNQIQNGTLGAFEVDVKSFMSDPKGQTSMPEPTEKPTVPEPNVYVIVTMKYTWISFCGSVEQKFREMLAGRSRDLKGNTLKSTDIYIVNGERNCENPDDTTQRIDVWFSVIGSDADEVTIKVGEDLKDLLESKQLGKLGKLFENRITDVDFGGKNAPRSSSSSDNKKIWLAVGIPLGVLVLAIVVYVAYYRRRAKRNFMGRYNTDIDMANIAGSKKGSTNIGFN